MSRHIPFLDKAFWLAESDASPKHVAALQFIAYPANNTPKQNRRYVSQLLTRLKTFNRPQPPFSSVLVRSFGFPRQLVDIPQLDMDYHVRHHRLKDVGDSAELNPLIARLHQHRLSPDKPLWQYHIIDSENRDEFVIYIKIHHLYGDGVTLMRWFVASLSERPNDKTLIPIWAIEPPKHNSAEHKPWHSGIIHPLRQFLRTAGHLGSMFAHLLGKLLRLRSDDMPLPFSASPSLLTGQLKPGRVVACADLPMDRVRALAKRTGSSVNEVLLTCFDIGIHQCLKQLGHQLDKPLICQMPINLRQADDHSPGNRFGIALLKLSTVQPDPYQRLIQVQHANQHVKQLVRQITPAACCYYTLCWQLIALIFEKLHLFNWFRPLGNILISNMPGPSRQLYYGDCKVRCIYPLSALPPGGGVNITLLTYQGVANIGLIGCNDQIKTLEPMAQNLVAAFEQLEACTNTR